MAEESAGSGVQARTRAAKANGKAGGGRSAARPTANGGQPGNGGQSGNGRTQAATRAKAAATTT
jgi:hypothetical protein